VDDGMQPDFPFAESVDQNRVTGLKRRQNGLCKLLFVLMIEQKRFGLKWIIADMRR